MKSLFNKLTLFGLFTLALISCKDDEVVDPFIRTWILTNIEISGCDDPDFNGSISLTCDDVDCFKIKFAKGDELTFIILDGGVPDQSTGIWSNAGGKLIMCFDNECDSPYSYAFNGNELVLTLTDDGDGCETILTLEKA